MTRDLTPIGWVLLAALMFFILVLWTCTARAAGKALTFDCTPAVDEITGAKLIFTVGGTPQPAVDAPLVATCGSDPLTKVTCTGASKTICYPDNLWPTAAFTARATVSNARDTSAESPPLNVPGTPSPPSLLRSIQN